MRILLWHVHGSWTTAFVQGRHQYLIPTLPGRGPDGRGRARTWDWPASAVEVTPDEAAEADVDVVVLQRPRELAALAARWRPWRVRHEPHSVLVACAGCRERVCPVPGHPCLDDVPVAAVLASVERLAATPEAVAA